MVGIRYAHYEPLLPEVDAEFRDLDSRMRLRIEQHKMLVKRRDDLLTTPRPEFLATPEEQAIFDRLEALTLQAGTDASAMQRIKRLKGVLIFRLETEYHERLTAAHVHLDELNTHVEELTRQYEAFVRTRQAATHSYVGYDTRIGRLRKRVDSALQRVEIVMARQGHLIETVAIKQLEARRERLVEIGRAHV